MRIPNALPTEHRPAVWRRWAGTRMSHPWRSWRRARRQRRVLAQVREGLILRGAAIDDLGDAELLDLIASGRKTLKRARVNGSEITAAYVMLVRRREKI